MRRVLVRAIACFVAVIRPRDQSSFPSPFSGALENLSSHPDGYLIALSSQYLSTALVPSSFMAVALLLSLPRYCAWRRMWLKCTRRGWRGVRAPVHLSQSELRDGVER